MVLLAILIVSVLCVLSGVKKQLAKLQMSAAPAAKAASVEDERDESGTEDELSGPFLDFLNEDPARREMPKKEQFAAYRRWRSARGLNWKAR